MPRPFFSATAEQVVAVVEAVVATGSPDVELVVQFTDLQTDRARSALLLAVDVGLLSRNGNNFSALNPIARFFRTPQSQEKSAVLRIMLEAYEPFSVFREELEASGDASGAASRTRARLSLTADRDDIKDTLVNLATYAGALKAGNGGRYERDSKSATNLLIELAAGAAEEAAAIHLVRTHLHAAANTVSHVNVVVPLAAAIRHAAGGAAREAVVHAGNAIDSFLSEHAARRGISITGATGINAKLDRLQAAPANSLPRKLTFNGKYLGHIRNAADHGIDTDIGAAWTIQADTGINFVFVALSFIRAVYQYESGQHEI